MKKAGTFTAQVGFSDLSHCENFESAFHLPESCRDTLTASQIFTHKSSYRAALEDCREKLWTED